MSKSPSRVESLAARLELGARELAAYAGSLSPAEWQSRTPGDGRKVGVIVHHVASVYPIEIELALKLAAGTPIVGVTWADVHAMNAAHAAERDGITLAEALQLLAQNSAAAAAAIRGLSEAQLDAVAGNSLYGDAPLSCQHMLEDHAVRHSFHHLAKLKAALGQPARA